jgi:hypothetical protein
MIIYDGTYRLGVPDSPRAGSVDGTGIEWWVRIIDFSLTHPGLRFLKPYAVFATPSDAGGYLMTCAQGLGATILNDFSIKPGHVVWVEHFKRDPGHLHVAVFKPISRLERNDLQEVNWRAIRRNELEMIRHFIPEAEFIELADSE